MKEQIESNIDSPAELEVLYQQDSTAFEKAFREISAKLEPSPVIDFWMARFNHESKGDIETISKSSTFNYYDLLFLIGAVLAGWAFLKIPSFTILNEDAFMMRNVTLSVLPAIAIYWTWKRKTSLKDVFPLAVIFCVSAIYINLLPVDYDKYGFVNSTDTLVLICAFFPVLLWITMGFCIREKGKTMIQSFSRLIPHSGELLVTSILVAMAWGLVYGFILLLFDTINIGFSGFFQEIWFPMAVSTPLIAILLTEAYPQLSRSLTSFLARCFVPLILLTFVAYFLALIFRSGENVFESRDFLITFNFVLLGTTAFIFFSLGNPQEKELPRWIILPNALLSSISVILTLAVVYYLISRSFTGGITPNRFAALGVDMILGVQLTAVAYQLFSLDAHKSTFDALKKAMTIPFYFYGAWAAIVIFAFPLIFHFK